MRVSFIPSFKVLVSAAAALGLASASSTRADPIVQFVSNNSGYSSVVEYDPTALGAQQGYTQQITRTQVSAPADQANWSSSGSTGGVGTTLTDNSVSASASAG